MIYRYKVNVADRKFDSAVDIINKIPDGKKDLSDIKKIKKNLNII